MFIRNQWYVASWDHEIDRAPFARTICGERIMLYRKFDRTVVALHDLGDSSVQKSAGTVVKLNRRDRLLTIKNELGLELLDYGASKAFAVADHQVAHIYLNDPSVKEEPLLDFSSGYVLRALDQLPRQGSVAPWKLYQNYALDLVLLALGRTELTVEDEDMELWFSTQRKHSWSPFLDTALRSLAQRLDTGEEEEGFDEDILGDDDMPPRLF